MLNALLDKKYRTLLNTAGIEVNGNNPWDIHIHNKNMYRDILLYGSLGLGESYMKGWWDCESLDEFFTRVIPTVYKTRKNSLPYIFSLTKNALANMQSIKRSFNVGTQHYDISPEFMRNMLGKSMMYSCGYWRNANTLVEAQDAKVKLTLDKLMLQPGMKILDIGCGWGGAAKYAAENYGVSVVGITISKNQMKVAREKCKGLPVDIRLQDYRDVDGIYDRIYSIGMFEHVGYKNFSSYMDIVQQKLSANGLFVLHTIGNDITSKTTCPWIDKYIFPGGLLPSASQITKVMENNFFIEDWQNFGHDYDKTLMAWYQNFITNWPGPHDNLDERFYRMWKYYLTISAAGFRTCVQFLWQIVLAKDITKKVYYSPR